MDVFFLGTGGGRFATITQKRRTGGIRILSGKINMHLDPGPGALIYSLEQGLNPMKIKMILISHCHPDHYSDGEILIEAMSYGASKRAGHLICAKSLISGNEVCEPSISKYHLSLLNKAVELKAGEKCSIDEVVVKAVRTLHYDPDGVGFRITFPNGKNIGYTSDTQYFEGLGKEYFGVDLLILCVIRPRNSPLKWHMCTDDAVKVVEEAKPKKAVLTHLGMRMITRTNPQIESKYIEERTGVPTIAAWDKMMLRIENKDEEKKKEDLTSFF